MPSVDPPYSDADIAGWGLTRKRLPRHVAIIMDGNGRWARRRGLPRIEGHRRGVHSVRAVVEDAARHRLQQLTLYCLSSENWKRPALELDLLMSLLQRFVIAERAQIMRQDIRLTTIGRTDRLPRGVLQEVSSTVEMSRTNGGLTLCLALDYGARAEIVAAVRTLARDVQSGRLAPDDIDEALLSARLDTAGSPDPDLVIRTAGEMRLSNFLLWQSSYAELWVTDDCWPDFRVENFREALRAFAARERRFGGLATPATIENPDPG